MNADEITAAYTALGRAVAQQEAYAFRAHRYGGDGTDEAWTVALVLYGPSFLSREQAEAVAAALTQQLAPLLDAALVAAEDEGLLPA